MSEVLHNAIDQRERAEAELRGWRKEARRLKKLSDEMLEVLETVENDGGQVPPWLWDRIQAVIARAKGAQ